MDKESRGLATVAFFALGLPFYSGSELNQAQSDSFPALENGS
jgi:hypothetical protein